MVDILPFADSKRNESSTGDINFLLQKNNPVFANIKKKNAVSATFSNETQSFNNETLTLESAGYKVIITGYVAQVGGILLAARAHEHSLTLAISLRFLCGCV